MAGVPRHKIYGGRGLGRGGGGYVSAPPTGFSAGGGGAISAPPAPYSPIASQTFAPLVPLQDYLFFSGNPQTGNATQKSFYALCGDEPPTVVDGYAKWGVIDRPLRQGLTIPQGFNPAKVQINLRFGIWDGRFRFHGWDTSPAAASQNELDIDTLHWMAGGGDSTRSGASPLVTLQAFSAQDPSQLIDLVPRQYWGVGWVVDAGIQWGTSLREPSTGRRIYQEASFTLLAFAAAPGQKATPPSTNQAGGYFRVKNKNHDTMIGIATAPSGNAPPAEWERLAYKISIASQNNPCRGTSLHLARKSIVHFHIPLGTAVWVPSHFI